MILISLTLTPDGYNLGKTGTTGQTVVAPSLTPDGYNELVEKSLQLGVVAPSLTPDGYNIDMGNRITWSL